jgi:2-succinyl-5-enolpyruvyl-6-hydroxy-3-cyclohexene-1-carboxylate synthase
METAELNLAWSDGLVAGLFGAGVTRAVISPGSRSTPLVLAVERHQGITTWVHPDERSAAFFALGLAACRLQPVALIATSGSAAAHWLPAAIEANHSGVPLILLSADRPAELQQCAANQTVDQSRLFADQVRASHNPGSPDPSDQALVRIRQLGAQAAHTASWPNPGPVHINLPFREPLVPRGQLSPPTIAHKIPPARPLLIPDPDQIHRVTDLINSGKGLIVCGPMHPDTHFREKVTALAGNLGCPLFADPLSQLRFGKREPERVITRYDAFIASDHFRHGEQPAWVLRFGAPPVSKRLQDYLDHSAAATIICAPRGDWPDPLNRAREMVRADPGQFCQALLQAAPDGVPESWLKRFTSAEKVCSQVVIEDGDLPFEGNIIQQMIPSLPDNAILFCGNSLPVRQLDLWSGQSDKILRLHANRGASGIDGNLSTLLGLAAAERQTVIGLVGDLAFFHDLNGLLLAREQQGVIILLNNQGGGIFGFLPQAELPAFEHYWLTPTQLDFSLAARLHKLDFLRVEKQQQFLPALLQALNSPGISVIEVLLDRNSSLDRQKHYMNRVKAAFSEKK